MDMTKLRYFVESAQCSSFTEAAKRQYTSQPNISKQISALEAELGTKLFVRQTRSVRLTRAGEYLYEQIRDLPGKMEQIFETTRAIGRSDVGELTIGLLSGQNMSRQFMERLARFSREYPDLNCRLERAGFRSLKEDLISSKFDMIITMSFDVEENDDFAVVPLNRQSVALFVSRMSAASEIKELGTLPFIAISPKESYGGYRQLVRFGEKNGFTPNIVRLADSLDSLLFYVETGIGVTILDRNTRLEMDGNILAIPVDDSEASVVCVWMKNNDNPNIRKMVGCLTDD